MSEFAGYLKGEPATRRIEAGLLMAGIATFVLLYNTQAILPYFARDYSISPATAALSVSVATAGLGIGLILAVPVSERIGRVRLIRWSLALAVVLSIVVSLIPSWPLFLCGRFCMGLVLAGLPGTAAVYLREEIHPSYATTATGQYIFGTTIGGLTGRLVSAGVIELLGRLGVSHVAWLDTSHLALAATVLVSALCAAGCWILLPESRGFTPHRDSVAELVAKFGRALRDPVLIGLYLLGALGMGAFVGTFNVIGFRLEQAPYLLSVGVVGLLYLVYPIGGQAGAFAGRLADRTSLRSVVVFGPVVALLGVAALAMRPLWVIILGLLLLSTGFFMVHSLASAWVAQRGAAGAGVPAQAASLYMLFYYAGSSLAGNVTPRAWELASWPGVTWVIGACMVICLVITIMLRRSRSLL
ncbi:MFS transporter [Brevibacterium sp. 91QC2O2]|uniref:MFS transporter n=1 Tax=Brevibacterium sp. 91QC2O2 TaxID=2968458 RepID=UPI00211CB14B|nr:MFS transporter [Brevibacterium sp. 91QC2O2]